MKRSPIQLKQVNYLGIDHEAVKSKFEGDLTFVNYINIGRKGDLPAAVYRAKKPNKKKGHKKFMLLYMTHYGTTDEKHLMVSGMERHQIQKMANVSGVLCLECNTAMYSLTGHHYHTCECPNSAMVDGGKNYLRYGAMKMSKIRLVNINLLTSKITIQKKLKRSA